MRKISPPNTQKNKYHHVEFMPNILQLSKSKMYDKLKREILHLITLYYFFLSSKMVYMLLGNRFKKLM